MQCLVVYDIPDDKARTKIADVCLDYGLDRIQFSAFLGNLARTHQEELLSKIKKALGKRAGNVQLFAICEKDWSLRLVIEQKGKADGGAAAVDDAPGPGRTVGSTKRRTPAAKGSQDDPAQAPASLVPPPAPKPKEEELPPF